MERTEVKIKEYMEYDELFIYFILPGLFFLLIEIILSNTRLRKIP
jgi:Ca-activated chloride channel family protein